MKLKLLIIIIVVAILSLVAYQKYSEYSALKSIDSYESCTFAKGSVIQESYPTTCVTRLGIKFTTNMVQYWSHYQNDRAKYAFDYPASWQYIPDTRDVWNDIIIGNGNGKDSLTSFVQVNINNSLNFYIPWSGKKEIILSKNNLGQYLYLGNTPASMEVDGRPAVIKKTAEHQGATTEVAVLDKDRIFSIQIFTPTDLQDLHDQILSTFKFTD